MLYPKNVNEKLDAALFKAPTAEYRSAPFWAWNGKLEDSRLKEQIDMLKTMGMGGFHMHVRTGMDSPYLTDDFMGHIQFCSRYAKDNGMLSWLYDEDRWPSGTAGGQVTAEHPEYGMKVLMLTVRPYDETKPQVYPPMPGYGQETGRFENGTCLAVYDIILNEDGTLRSSARIGKTDRAEGRKWYAYLEHCTDDPWFNNHPYVDTLQAAAVRKFIDITHERYAGALSDEFGQTVPAIFTDEPHFAEKVPLIYPDGDSDVFFPWTDGLAERYAEVYGEDLFDRLPELVWELPDGAVSRTRYRFHDLVADVFSKNYCGQIGAWCEEHGLSLTGHVLEEPTLLSQTGAVGDAMRCYPYFGIPGIDMLCDFHEYNTAKQTQSIVRQAGREGMLSELYGVTGWDYDFRGYKLQGDWQAALGVTVRVPHLTWMTMKGEAKRDYPACIGYQSPWWDQYRIVEDHFARLNTALTRGKPEVRVAVIHPIESYWLYWGPSYQTEEKRSRMDRRFAELTEWLLFGQIDFDFINEASFPGQCESGGNPLRVGQMAYDAVIVANCRTLRETTVRRLEAFKNAGGRLIFAGSGPDLMDAVPSERVAELSENAVNIDFDRTAILNALKPNRFLDIRDGAGRLADSLLYQLRSDGEGKWLFIANGQNPVSPDVENAPEYRFSISGSWRLTEYDTRSGEIRALPARQENGFTVFERIWYMHDSLLLRLEPCEADDGGAVPEKAAAAGLRPRAESVADTDASSVRHILHEVKVRLDEPNMLLLDMAEYSIDGGEWQGTEEILRIDNIARKTAGIPLRRKEIVQPYLLPAETPEHRLRLRFTVPSEIEVPEPLLALEDAALTSLTLNGEDVIPEVTGWFVDRDIETVKLPPLKKGLNVLEAEVPVGKRTNLEAMYLLGDFGVRVRGTEKTVTDPVRSLGFGDIVPQGLPFYTGNLHYFFDLETEDTLTIRVPQYRGGLIRLYVDGEDRGSIVFSPYRLTVTGLERGVHHIDLKLYGTRQNGFAQLHHTQGVYFYQSPNSWRSDGDLWSYEYRFKPMGILKSPEIG